MNIFNTIKSSMYDPEFYADLKNRRTKSSVKYFVLFALILALVSTFLESYKLAPLSNQVFDPKSIDALILQYPEELTVTIKNGLISTNVKEPYSIFKPVSTSTFGGVGMESSNGIVTDIYVGKPADHAGIQKGDVILSIDGEQVSGLSQDEIIGKIRGIVGVPVTLLISRVGKSEPLSFKIVRTSIQTEAKKFVLIDTSVDSNDVSLNDFQQYDTAILVTKNALISVTKNGFETLPIGSIFKTDTTINRGTIRSTIDKYQPAAKKVLWFIPVILFMTTFMMTMLYLIIFFITSLWAWILLRILNKNYGYLHAYRITLHAMTLALIVSTLFGHRWYLDFIIIALVIFVNFTDKKNEEILVV